MSKNLLSSDGIKGVYMKKVMVVFGTRPEAIKMCPLIHALQKKENIKTIVCVTGQHREMLNQVLDVFAIKPDYDLGIMQKNQTLADITSQILTKMSDILSQENPNLLLVHGDTSTTYVAALAAFYMGIPIGHVEAGLRTYNMTSPFPEEFNRQSVSLMADYHFAPTQAAKENLLKEGKEASRIYVTGNTVIDALKTTVRTDYTHPILDWAQDSRMILVTAHRRENLGRPMAQMFAAIKRLVDDYEDIKVIYPVHLNPKIQSLANDILGNHQRIQLVEPFDVIDFHNLMAESYLILTDSGGIQEEAPSLGKPVLIMRETTERLEGISAGTSKLVGTNEEKIYRDLKTLLTDENVYNLMAKASNPYGDGLASERIAAIIEKEILALTLN